MTLLGENLTSDNTTVRLQHPELSDSINVSLEPNQSESEMILQLPNLVDDPETSSKWPAGFYKLSLLVQRPDSPAWTSNQVSMPLAPSIESISPTSAPAGNAVLTIECIPQIAVDQRVVLLFGDRTIQPDPDGIVTPADPAAKTTLTFTVNNTEPGIYVLRLRVDGVDSIPVDFSGDTPQFADNQKVTIS